LSGAPAPKDRIAPTKNVAGELAALAALTLPLAASYLAEMAMSFTDTVVVARLGPLELGAAGLAATIFFSLLLACMGVISMVGVFAAEAHAKNDMAAVAASVRQGYWVSLLLSVPAMALSWHLAPILGLLDQDPAILPFVEAYVQAVLWCFLPYMLITVLRGFLTALAHTMPILIVTAASVVLNLLANYALVFGHFGFPALGVAGAGWATSIVCWAMLGGLVLYIELTPRFRAYGVTRRLLAIDWPVIARMLRLGLPAGGMTVAENTMFTVVALLMWVLGTAELAANQAASTFLSILFMVPVAIGQAAATRVALAQGLKNVPFMRRVGVVAIVATAIYMVFVALLIWAFPAPIARIFLDPAQAGNEAVIDVTIGLLVIAAISQVSDGIQVVAAGALRGIGDTAWPFLFGLFGFGVVGLGAGTYFAFGLELGARGLWLGVALGLTVSAAVFTWRFHVLSRRPLPETA
jgi:MATE family multidrug resistance protein